MSFEIIIPFLKPIEHLLESARPSPRSWSTPMARSGSKRTGRFNCCPSIRFDDGALQTGLEVIANRFGKKLDADSPILNLRLPDGSRMAAMIPPVVNPRPLMTIRRFTSPELHAGGPDTSRNAHRGTGCHAYRRSARRAEHPHRRGTGSGKIDTTGNVWPTPYPSMSASCSSKTPRSCTSASRTSSPPSRRPTPIAARSPSTTCSKPSSGIARTASSSEKYAGRRRGPCSTP